MLQLRSIFNRGTHGVVVLALLLAQVAPLITMANVASAADSGFKTATAAHAPNNWTVNAVANTQTSDNVYVSTNNGNLQGYSNFGLNVPANALVRGITVETEAKSTDDDCRLGVDLSWNNGNNWTNSQYTNLSENDSAATLGGTSDNWGHSWTAAELSDANFVVRLEDNDPGISCSNSATTSVDLLRVKVEYVEIATNPTLTQACGLDIAIVMDNSNSIDSSEMNSMRSALKGFTNALNGTPTQFSVTKFGTNASVVQPFTSNVATVNTAIDNVSTGGGGTNWEAGLIAANSTFDPRPTKPNLVIFATDGNPTYHNGGGNGSSTSQADLDAAITQANIIKTSGTRVLALGIGNDLDMDNLKVISGANANTGSVLTSDVISSSFDTLAAQLKAFASETCGATITTTKIIDTDGNPATTNDQTLAAGWNFTIAGGTATSGTTDANGQTPAVKVTPGSNYSVTEVPQAGYGLVSSRCTGAGNNGQSSGNAVTGIQIAADNIVSCTFINTPLKGSITITKDAQPNSPQSFNFTATGNGVSNFSLVDNGNPATASRTFTSLLAGNYSFSEQATTGWRLKNLVCSNGANTTINGGNVSIALAAGQNVTCTYTNEKLARLSITKATNPAISTQAFDFTTTGAGLSNFSLDTDPVSGTPATKQFVDLVPGAYGVTEAAVANWDLTGLTCTGTSNYTRNSSTLSVTLASGDDIACTFVNTQRGSLSGVKYLVNADGSVVSTLPDWVIELRYGEVVYTTTTDANGAYSFNSLLPNISYLITEQQQTGYTQITPAAPGSHSVTLTAGQNSTGNNFGNFKNGSASGIKWNDLNGNGSRDEGEPTLANWSIQLKQGDVVLRTVQTTAQGAYTFDNLAPGSYTICEVQQNGWTQTAPAQNSCHSITIDQSGETNPNLNFGNQGRATIRVNKNVDDGFGNITSGNDTWQWQIGNSGDLAMGTSREVAAGSSVIRELQQTNYHFTSLVCSINNESIEVTQAEEVSLTLGAGDSVVCTYTNTRDTGELTVYKDVVNEHGGTKTYQDFTFSVNEGTAQSFEANQSDESGQDGEKTLRVPTGSYNVVELEANQDGYTTSYDGCSEIVVSTEEPATCVITNSDIAPQLTVVKHVVNDNGRSTGVEAFGIKLGNQLLTFDQGVFDATTRTTTYTATLDVKAGNHSLSEQSIDGYQAGTWSCGELTSEGQTIEFELVLAQNLTCEITNNDTPIPSTPGRGGAGPTVTQVVQQIKSLPYTTSGRSVGIPFVIIAIVAMFIVGASTFVNRRTA